MRTREIDISLKRELKDFIGFPFELYSRSECWVPPIVSEMATVLNPQKHPFYQHSGAAFFVVESGQKRLGQIAVLNNRRYNEFHGKKAAIFYFFDAVEDSRAARMLFETGFTWARQQGLEEMVGPLGFHVLDGRGILVGGFELLPATGIPYNYSYYGSLVEENGFNKKCDFLSGIVDYQEFPERFHKIKEGGEKRRFWVQSFFSKQEVLQWKEALRQIYNQTFTELIDHYPMTEEEMDFVVKRLIDIVNPRLIKIVMKEDQPAGFILVYPNIVRGIKKAGGKIWPFGWFHLLRETKRTKRVDLNGVALLPGYRNRGGTAVLYAELKESLKEFGFKQGEIVQIEEGNKKSLGEAGLVKVNWCKRHRVYAKNLL